MDTTWPRQAKGPVPAQCPRLQGKGQMFELFLVYKRNVCSHPEPLCLHDRRGWRAAVHMWEASLGQWPSLAAPLLAVGPYGSPSPSPTCFLLCKMEKRTMPASEGRVSRVSGMFAKYSEQCGQQQASQRGFISVFLPSPDFPPCFCCLFLDTITVLLHLTESAQEKAKFTDILGSLRK